MLIAASTARRMLVAVAAVILVAAAVVLTVCGDRGVRVDAAQLCMGLEESSEVCVPLP